ncbi:transcriptional regulator, partial [Myxococcota bacterium]
ASLSAKDRNLLRQSLLDGLSIDQLGAIYRVHRATAARWLAGARERVLKETLSALRQRLKIDEAEFKSLINLVRSQLDLSLARLLDKDKGKRED